MTENEAKIFIQNAMEQSKKALAELLLISPKVFTVRKKSLGEYYSNLENCKQRFSHVKWRFRHWKRYSAGIRQLLIPTSKMSLQTVRRRFV